MLTGSLSGPSAHAQSDAELAKLNRRVQQLSRAGNYREALGIAERYVAAARKRHGEEHPEFALAITSLARVLVDTDRLSEAEPLYRRTLAINENSFGPDHPNVARDLNNLALLLQATNRMGDAETLMRRVLAIYEKQFGADNPNVALALSNLAHILQSVGRLAEAEPLMRRALVIDERSSGLEHPNVAIRLNNLAQLLHDTNRLGEAETLMRRVLAIDEKTFGPEQPNVASHLNNLAILLQDTNRFGEAEPLLRRALAIDEKVFGPKHSSIGRDLNNLAELLHVTGRLSDAEPLIRRGLAIDENSFGPEHPNVAIRLNNLASLLNATDRLVEAEPLYRRALAINEKSFGPDHPSVANLLNNLAELLRVTNHAAESERLYRRALVINEKNLGPDHPSVATLLNNLSLLLQETNRLSEAEPSVRRALAISEKSLGPDHPSVAVRLNNLAALLRDTGRLAEAEPFMRRALAVDEKSYGPGHPNVARDLTNLAWLVAERGDWADAALLGRRAKPLLVARKTDEAGDRPGLAKLALAHNTLALRAHARALHRAAPTDAAAREEAFELAQWALQTGAADALSQMSVRFAKGSGPLARVVREHQDFLARRRDEMRRLDVAAGKADRQASESAVVVVAALDRRLDAIDARFAREFKDYAELANPKPLTIASTQELLRPDEALLLFLDVPQFGRLPGEILAWVITKATARWRSIPLGSESLFDLVAALRCGLDAANWENTLGWPDATDLDPERIREQKGRRERCKQLLGVEMPGADGPPFDLARAHALYKALFGEVEDLIKDKHLLLVSSGALNALPFQVLVTHLSGGAPSGEREREVALLGAELGIIPEDLRNRLKMDGQRGVLIVRTVPGGPAENAGLKANDILLSLAATDVMSVPQAVQTVQAQSPRASVQARVLRQSKPIDLIVTLGAKTIREWVPRILSTTEGEVQWLGIRQALTVLPAVSSLRALRSDAKPSRATDAYIGFGNPLLTGPEGTDKRAWGYQRCQAPETSKRTRMAQAGRAPDLVPLRKSGLGNVADLRRQYPLPETAEEVCAVARTRGILDPDKAVNLGAKATEARVKALSASGTLARARVVHFATHGLVAGETAIFANNRAEPALLLTPPETASEEDDGLLTASEVTALNLDADWVILSACNTAAGDSIGGDALSGLARAFFYAGARALLVSHWYVDSEATVALITKSFAALEADPKIGRAEALRRAMTALTADGGRAAHPSTWAPFVVVGEGAAGQ